MKSTLLVLAALMSMSAFAGGSYNCDVSVTKDGELIGKIKLEQMFGMSSGHLYTIPVSKKKNIFGKTIEEVDVVLAGLIISGSDASESSLEGEISVNKTTYKRTIKTERTLITKVQGSGNLSINGNAGDYSVNGSCDYNTKN